MHAFLDGNVRDVNFTNAFTQSNLYCILISPCISWELNLWPCWCLLYCGAMRHTKIEKKTPFESWFRLENKQQRKTFPCQPAFSICIALTYTVWPHEKWQRSVTNTELQGGDFPWKQGLFDTSPNMWYQVGQYFFHFGLTVVLLNHHVLISIPSSL